MKQINGPVALVILDGLGYSEQENGNAVELAETKTLDQLEKTYPNILINAHGEHVGLPGEQMGNSEVGHLNIGAGRIVNQSLQRVNQAIANGELRNNKKLLDVINKGNNIHIFGLISDGGVHSDIDHIIEIYNLSKESGKEVFLHAQLDGRDVGPKTAIRYLEKLEDNNIKISSISGRFYSMDRDQRWERVEKFISALKHEEGNEFNDAIKYVEEQYSNGTTDEFVEPAYNNKMKPLANGDSLIVANFRQDRLREFTHILVGSDLTNTNYEQPSINMDIDYISLMPITGINEDSIFVNKRIVNTIGEVLEANNIKQMRAAETEKYPHVTFFMDGGLEIKKQNETRIMVNSPKVSTYDQQPEMSAQELTDKIIENINDNKAMIINYANPDMVGHTGDIPSVIKSIETVDQQLKRLYKEIVYKRDGVILVVADHGNAEKMLQEDGTPHTAHTNNPVRLILTSKDFDFKKEFTNETKGKLADIAPTILSLLDIKIPEEMTGSVLIEEPNWIEKVQD